jgi:hypothetical protein
MKAGTGAFKDHAGRPPSRVGSGESFMLDMEVCRKTFEAFDRDKSGYLDLEELAKLAEALWNTFHPEGPKLDKESIKVPCARCPPPTSMYPPIVLLTAVFACD